MARKNKGPWKHAVTAQRRKDAEARQDSYNKLTPQERLAKLDKYGFKATKERAKIQKQLETGKQPEKTEHKKQKRLSSLPVDDGR